MGKMINCECGEVVRAASDDELVEKVERHLGAAHTELVGKLSRDDVLGWPKRRRQRAAPAPVRGAR